MPQSNLSVLLVEPQPLIRSLVVSVGRQLDLACIEETASVEVAVQRLEGTRYDGLLLSLEDHGRAVALLERLRAGGLASPAGMPVVAMTACCTVELAMLMKQLDVRRLLLKPFKVKTVLESIEAIAAEADQREPA
jgi:DNA-binding NarL/FixJ family response regulator